MNREGRVPGMSATVPIDNLIPASEACAMLRISRPGLSNLIASGKLHVVKTLSNGAIVLDRTVVEKLAEERQAS